MNKIRKIKTQLGTDVKYTFTFNNPDGTKMTIVGVYGIFVNKTLRDELKKRSAKDNLHRYPCEPYCGYDATEYVLNQSGRYGYYAYPIQMIKHKPFNRMIKYPATIQYTKQSNVVDVAFLADAQIEPGEYDLVLFIRCADDGKFRENNIRKFSVTYSSILELTCGSDYEEDDEPEPQPDDDSYVYSDNVDPDAIVYSQRGSDFEYVYDYGN